MAAKSASEWPEHKVQEAQRIFRETATIMNPAPYMPASKTVEWETPQSLFDSLHQEFEFTLDVCATEDNAKCARFYTKEEDGLKQEWAGVCWCNPPYGREIYDWVAKAASVAISGKATTVLLLPSRTDTRWWHEYVEKYGETRFIRGRLKFGGSKDSAPFASVIVIFRAR